MGDRDVRRALAVLALVVCGCTQEFGHAAEPIVGGEPSSDQDVVAVVPRRSLCGEVPSVVCTGLLIAPRAVLTAAHCLRNRPFPGELEVAFGATVGPEATYVVVQAVAGDPAYDRVTGEHDVALLALAADAPVAPRTLTAASVEALAAGAPLRVVGFGASSRGDEGGVRRSGTMMLGEVREASFDAVPGPGLSCHGDSGGPVLATVDGAEVVVGLTASGDPACLERATNVRIDAILDGFVVPALETFATLGEAWPSSTIPLDDIGDVPCTAHADCPALTRCGTNAAGEPRCALPGLGAASVGPACGPGDPCQCARIWPDGPDACRCADASVAPPPPSTSGGSCAIGRPRQASWLALLLVALVLGVAPRRRGWMR